MGSRRSSIKHLGGDFVAEVDRTDQHQWSEILSGFSDANIYQTWPYEVVRSGAANSSRIVLKAGCEVLAAAQTRIVRVPFVKCGIAYIRWGPLWKARSENVEVFRQMLRALQAEYVIRRGLGLRLLPHLCEGEHDLVRTILTEEGFVQQQTHTSYRTIIMDIRPTLEELQRGFHQKWRNCLTGARKRNLEILEGDQDELFEAFESVYAEMQDRKRFVEGATPRQFRMIQRELPASEKMRAVLCKADGEVCAGAICSALGDTGVYLLGATSNQGMKTNGSYLAQWRMLEWLKERGCRWYNLNGINPEKNEGGYRFKLRFAGVHGRDVRFLGQFDAYPNAAVKFLIGVAELLRARLRSNRGLAAASGSKDVTRDGGEDKAA